MAQDVAVPCVLMTEVDHSDWSEAVPDRRHRRVDLRESLGGAQGHRRVQRTDAVGKRERNQRFNRPQGDDRVLQRVHPDGVLPAQFVGIGQPDKSVPADPVEDLHVEEMEMDRVRIHAIVGDPPDLDLVRPYDLGGRIDEILEDEVCDRALVNGISSPSLALILP